MKRDADGQHWRTCEDFLGVEAPLKPVPPSLYLLSRNGMVSVNRVDTVIDTYA